MGTSLPPPTWVVTGFDLYTTLKGYGYSHLLLFQLYPLREIQLMGHLTARRPSPVSNGALKAGHLPRQSYKLVWSARPLTGNTSHH